MTHIPCCPQCNCDYAYEDRHLFVCPNCAHEWTAQETSLETSSVQDAYGNTLIDGDTISIIKDLKIKGSSQVVKMGTKVKNIRLIEGDHNIDCKIDGIGPMKLKSEFVKKMV